MVSQGIIMTYSRKDLVLYNVKGSRSVMLYYNTLEGAICVLIWIIALSTPLYTYLPVTEFFKGKSGNCLFCDDCGSQECALVRIYCNDYK